MGKVRKWVNVAAAELEDLIEDMELLLEECHRRKKSEELTNYVYRENCALINHQMQGVKRLMGSVREIKPDDRREMDEIVKSVAQDMKKKIKEYDLPECLYYMAKKRLYKALEYVKNIQ